MQVKRVGGTVGDRLSFPPQGIWIYRRVANDLHSYPSVGYRRVGAWGSNPRAGTGRAGTHSACQAVQNSNVLGGWFMPVSGRKPKPQGQAVTRHPQSYEWTEVPNVPFTDR